MSVSGAFTTKLLAMLMSYHHRGLLVSVRHVGAVISGITNRQMKVRGFGQREKSARHGEEEIFRSDDNRSKGQSEVPHNTLAERSSTVCTQIEGEGT